MTHADRLTKRRAKRTPQHPILEMLSYCRPMGSPAEAEFRARYLEPLPNAWTDIHGNIHVQVGESRCLWSCHTDTVHRKGGRQRVQLTAGVAHLPFSSKSNCLGADDTAGIYLMREMILQGIAGNYVFHWGEERGGIGSSALAAHLGAGLTAEFDYAIALDRRGTGNVITHQAGSRSCSDAFAVALAAQIDTVAGLPYAPAHGVYTDTAEYAALIPECSNLSVGYQAEHTPNEELNIRHLDRLLGALCDLDTASLPVVRVPVDPWDVWDEFDEDDRAYGSHYADPAWGAERWDHLIREYEERCERETRGDFSRRSLDDLLRDEDIRWR